MGIKIGNGKSLEGMDYNDIFVKRVVIVQTHRDNVSDHALFDAVVKYRMYGVDSQGFIHYSGQGLQTAKIDDFLKFAEGKAVTGNILPLQTFGSLQELIALLIAEHRNTSATTY